MERAGARKSWAELCEEEAEEKAEAEAGGKGEGRAEEGWRPVARRGGRSAVAAREHDQRRACSAAERKGS